MPHPSSIETQNLKSRTFTRLDLGPNDHLQRDIELVLAYDYRIDPTALGFALNSALDAFPHLTGRLVVGDPWFIEPKTDGVRYEIANCEASISTRELAKLSLAEHRDRFIPVSDDLFGIRLTQTGENMSILGIRASHAAVDGTGLAWFLHHCTVAMRGTPAIPVIHERSAGRGEVASGPFEMPDGYALEKPGMENRDPIARQASTIFTIEIAHATRQLSGKSSIATRLSLSAWLCAKLSAMEPSFRTVSVWCDPRGLNGIPATFTGNSGCYLNFPLDKCTATDLTQSFRSLTTRSGFSRIAATHRSILQAEQLGQPITWTDSVERVIQLNLVPHAAESANFGLGTPKFGLMLSRNSSGLRISITPDGTNYLIEACFKGNLGERLFDACGDEGFEPQAWCRGKSTSEPPC